MEPSPIGRKAKAVSLPIGVLPNLHLLLHRLYHTSFAHFFPLPGPPRSFASLSPSRWHPQPPTSSGTPTVSLSLPQLLQACTVPRWPSYRYQSTLPRASFRGGFFFLASTAAIRTAGHQNCPQSCLLYTSPSPRDLSTSRMPSSA